jgi:hypothetical protein
MELSYQAHCSTHLLCTILSNVWCPCYERALEGGASCRRIRAASVGEVAKEVEDRWGLRVVTAKRAILHIEMDETIVVVVRPKVK